MPQTCSSSTTPGTVRNPFSYASCVPAAPNRTTAQNTLDDSVSATWSLAARASTFAMYGYRSVSHEGATVSGGGGGGAGGSFGLGGGFGGGG